MEGPPIWQRLLGALAYLLPLSDALRFGQSLFDMFPLLGWLALPALPLVVLEQAIPFGGLVLFLLLFLLVVRNPRVPYPIRFNVLQAILIDIVLVLLSLAFDTVLAPSPTRSSWARCCWCCSRWSRACGARRPTSPPSPRRCGCSSSEGRHGAAIGSWIRR